MRDRKLLEGRLKHPALVFTDCHTGSCGSESKVIHLLYAGADVDMHADELALENAEMYGIYRGEPCDEDDETEYSEGIEGTPYLFHADDLYSTHTSAHEILGWLREVEAIHWIETANSSIVIDVEAINRVMDYDFKSFCELVEDNISGNFLINEVNGGGNIYTIEIAGNTLFKEEEPRLFGTRDWNDGWTINELITACRESRAAETSLDEMLGGDLAASEIAMIDLIAYIRELESK